MCCHALTGTCQGIHQNYRMPARECLKVFCDEVLRSHCSKRQVAIVFHSRSSEGWECELAALRFYEAMRWAQKANRSDIDEDMMLRCEAQSRARLDSAVKWHAETVNRIITMLAEGTGH